MRVAQVLQAVLPKLQDPNPNVAANVINTVGVLSKVGSAEVVLKSDEIFPLMMEAVQVSGPSSFSRLSL